MKKFLLSLDNHKGAIFALITANIIWGAASPIFKLALENIPPFTLAFLRFYFASFLLLPFVVKNMWLEKKDILPVILVSFFGVTINITFFFLGLKMAPSINAPIIASSGPIFLYLFSLFILMEKPRKRWLAGILVSFTGILFIVIQPILKNGINGEVAGNLFFILATLGSVGHVICFKKLPQKYPASVITFWTFFIGSLTFFPFFLNEMVTLHPFNTIDWRGILGLIFGIVFSSTIAYLLFGWGIKKIKAQEAGIFTYIDPVIAAIIAIPLLGERITPVFLIGSLFVFLGIFIAEGRVQYHPFHKIIKKNIDA